MFYPIIMLLLLGSIMVFLMAVVMPQIQQMFVQMNAELPTITKIVIAASEFITNPLKALGLVVTAAASMYAFIRWKGTPNGRAAWERFLLRAPIVGPLVRKVLLARFARNLGVMLQSRVQLLAALTVVSKIVDNSVFEAETSVLRPCWLLSADNSNIFAAYSASQGY